MRLIGWLLLGVMLLGWLASEIPSSGSQPVGQSLTDWRRTAQGWQRVTWGTLEQGPRRPTLHPVVVAAGELMLALAALIAFSVPERPAGLKHRRPQRVGHRHSGLTGPYRFVEATYRSSIPR